MHGFAMNYARYFNRQYKRTGTLWEGRFRSCLVDSARYVLACYRYIECNPVEARMVDAPAAYRWSSHAGNSGIGQDPLVTPHVEYTALAETLDARQSAYRGIFNLPADAEAVKALRHATAGGYALIGDQLKSRLLADGERVEPGKPGPKKKPDAQAGPASLDLFGELAP
jgi:putative transposase